MRLLFVDFESTGRNTQNDRIVELGYALVEVGQHVPLLTYSAFLYDKSYPSLTKEVTAVHGITDEMLKEFGSEPVWELSAFARMCESVDYVVSHNWNRFDGPLLRAETSRLIQLPGAPCFENFEVIDTLEDIPYHNRVNSRKLEHLAVAHGFVPLFPHRAIYDVLTLVKIFNQYDFKTILDYRSRPWCVIKADTNYDQRQLAKDAGFRWQEIDDKVYEKSWVKKIKLDTLEQERERCPFQIQVL